MAGSGTASRSRVTPRQVLFWLHLAAGAVAGIVVLTMSVTGVLLAYERQVSDWADRKYRPPGSVSDTVRLSVEDLLPRVIEAAHAIPATLKLYRDPQDAGEAGFGRERTLLVDPYTGSVLGERSPSLRAFFRTVEDWHRWLGASGENRAVGRSITGACNLAFLFLVVSGPFLWIPKRWSAAMLKRGLFFQAGLKGRARDWNWHNVIGFWCAVPLFLIVLTGVIMSYPWANDLLYRVTGNDPPARRGSGGPRRAEPVRQQSTPSWNGLDQLWTRVAAQSPDWRSITMRVPNSPRAAVSFTIDQGSGGRPDQRSQLTLDRRSGAVIEWEPFASYNLGRRLRSWARFTHTGEAGGFIGQTIAGIATGGGVVLVWTGLAMGVGRFRGWRQRKLSPERAVVQV